MKNIKKVILMFLIGIIFITSFNVATAKEVDKETTVKSVLFGDSYIIDKSGYISETYINLINEKNNEIFDNYGYNIFIYIPSENEYIDASNNNSISSQLDSFAATLYDRELGNKDILLVIDLINRYMSIEYEDGLYYIDNSTVINNYAKESFSKDNFNKAIVECIDGIIDINNKNFENSNNNEITMDSPLIITDTITLDSYVTDLTNTLSDADLDYLESNAYKINNNYNYKIYIVLLNSKDYDINNFTSKIFTDNFYLESNTVLIALYMDKSQISTIASRGIFTDVLGLYNTYSKTYFHEEPANYKDGLYVLQNAIISDIEGIDMEGVSELSYSGAKKPQTSEDINVIFGYVKIVGFVLIVLFVLVLLVFLIKKILYTEENIKKDILNNDPEHAFLNLQKEIDKKETFMSEEKIDHSMDDLYKTAAEEILDKSIEKKEYQKETKNIFNSTTNTSTESDMVTESINNMIMNLVQTVDGTKEHYQELQSALDIYNNLSFSERIKLDRKYTSELEQLTRKAKLDKELFEKHNV